MHRREIASVATLTAWLAGCGACPRLQAQGRWDGLPAKERISLVVSAALEQTRHSVRYDPSYVPLRYPGGDVPSDRGVCTDVVIRAFRKAGVDLQVLVHEDMKRAFDAYPKRWRQSRPDRSVDHRRVLNLMTFFQRQGKDLRASGAADDYLPGDVVAWKLPSGTPHIGIVVDRRADRAARHQVVHNLGQGPKLEDVLFAYELIGHYRYLP